MLFFIVRHNTYTVTHAVQPDVIKTKKYEDEQSRTELPSDINKEGKSNRIEG